MVHPALVTSKWDRFLIQFGEDECYCVAFDWKLYKSSRIFLSHEGLIANVAFGREIRPCWLKNLQIKRLQNVRKTVKLS